MAIERIDNGNGTTTFRGVDVTIPTRLASKYDVIAVRGAKKGEIVESCGEATSINATVTGTALTILAPRPTWKPPASLNPGMYEWNGITLSDTGFESEWAKKSLRDWTDPPTLGYWQVNEDGTATYLGES